MRYTKTKLEKIMMIGFSRIDQIIDKACDDLDAIKPSTEVPTVNNNGMKCNLEPYDRQRRERAYLEAMARAAQGSGAVGGNYGLTGDTYCNGYLTLNQLSGAAASVVGRWLQ